MTDKVESFWQEFLRATGRSPEMQPIGVFSFDITEESANALLELVLSGKKRATSSSLHAYELDGEPIPKEGDLSIVTDWAGNPRCVIMTKEVTIIPYKDMTFDICSREGEDARIAEYVRLFNEQYSEPQAVANVELSASDKRYFELQNMSKVFPLDAEQEEELKDLAK